MGKVSRLGDLIDNLSELDQDATIYAEAPWTSESTAILAYEPESGGVPLEASKLGLEYFLEIFVAQEFLEGWESTCENPPTVAEQCNRLIRYAVDDA